jgi:hypothetical protein
VLILEEPEPNVAATLSWAKASQASFVIPCRSSTDQIAENLIISLREMLCGVGGVDGSQAIPDPAEESQQSQSCGGELSSWLLRR